MTDEIIFYDVASIQGSVSWSINSLKSRIYLNYKGLPYRTVWISLCNVRSELPAIGFSPKTEGREFSVPAIEWRGQKLMDSWAIAQALEKVYPSPTLQLDASVVTVAAETAAALFDLALPMTGGPIFETHLTEADREFMFKERLGITSIDQFGGQSEAVWDRVFDRLQTFINLLKENHDGPFILGEQFSYADVYLATFLTFLERTDSRIFEKMVGRDQVLTTFVEAALPWTRRSD